MSAGSRQCTMLVFPGFDNLFRVKDPLLKRPFRGEVRESVDLLWLLRGEVTQSRPVRVGWAMGSGTPGDVIWTTAAFALILSEIAVGLLKAAGCTGWRTFPAQVVGKDGQEYGGYYGLSVLGRCGPIDYSRSAIVWRRFPGGLYPRFKGEYFEPTSWDGSDLFMEHADSVGYASASIYATNRASAGLIQFKNVEFEKLRDAEMDIDGLRIGSSAHRLPADIDARIRAASRESDDKIM